MKKILFFTCEPGGAEVLIPVIKNMIIDDDFDVTVLGYGFAIDRFKRQGIDFELIEPIKKDDSSLLEKYKPDYILTSATSLPQKDMSEKYLWYNAKKKNIPTMAFLDQWQNYTIRFSGIEKNESMTYQPDIINCINNIGKNDMLKLGFDDDKLKKFGQPYLSSLENDIFNIDKSKILQDLQIDTNKEIVLFVSEPIEEHFGKSRGYTQYDVLKYILENNNFIENKQIIVKLHPKDDISKFNKYKDIILVQNEYSAFEMISISDFVIGMTSVMLIEAYILKKKVLSIQLNSDDDLMILSREMLINKIASTKHLLEEKDFFISGSLEYLFSYKNFKEFLINEKNY